MSNYISAHKRQSTMASPTPSATELCLQYGHWGEDPSFPVADWQYEVSNNETRLGYWEWVENRIRPSAPAQAGDDS